MGSNIKTGCLKKEKTASFIQRLFKNRILTVFTLGLDKWFFRIGSVISFGLDISKVCPFGLSGKRGNTLFSRRFTIVKKRLFQENQLMAWFFKLHVVTNTLELQHEKIYSHISLSFNGNFCNRSGTTPSAVTPSSSSSLCAP